MTSELVCSDQRRRDAVRSAGSNGLDYLEVGDDQRLLSVFFLGKAPAEVRRDNVRITGGAGARVVEVTGDPVLTRHEDPDVDDCMVVRVNQPGDLSTYTLCLVELDDRGRPTELPLAGFDPRHACLDFSFAAGCPSDLDCAPAPTCPPEPRDAPDIDYLAKDYASFRRLLLDRLSLVLPQWQERHVPDLGITLVELLAYAGDHLSYHQDAVATEAYLATARQRISVRRHARLVDYPMHEGCNARALVCLSAPSDQTVDLSTLQFLAMHDVVSPTPTPQQVHDLPSGSYEVFEPMVGNGPPRRVVRAAQSSIDFYTWQDQECCLPAGATTATLTDTWAATGGDVTASPGAGDGATQTRPRRLRLEVGDLLILEEVKGPRTGDPADADRTHRHPVRLTYVTPGVDPLGSQEGQPVVDVQWADEDALPFALCVSSLREGDCAVIDGVSVARGNVLLVDHGRSVGPEPVGAAEAFEGLPCCLAEGRPADVTPTPRPFAPRLQQSPLTFRQPLTDGFAPAAILLGQEPRGALPAASLHQHGNADPSSGWDWSPRRDLLDSGPGDRHFVAEVDNDGIARLRFGDGRLGRRPDAGSRWWARYRVGNGIAGNVGAEAIDRVVFTNSADGRGGDRELTARNPLPAGGGTDAEPVAEVKALAPARFRSRIERAVTTDDYAALAARDNPRVQRAAARLRWTGGWYEVLTTVDASGSRPADETLLNAVAAALRPYRRIGHDLVVASADYVALDIELTVCVLPGFLRGHVKAALLDRLGNRALPSGGRGYFHPDNLSFGEPVTTSGLTAAAQSVPGVESVQVTRLQRLYAAALHELEEGILRLGPTEVARLDNDPNAPDHGVLTLRLRGGR